MVGILRASTRVPVKIILGFLKKDISAKWFTSFRYDENNLYDFQNGRYSDATGHFTQLVWKGAKRLGIGKAIGKYKGLDCNFIVARYSPPGNVRGQFQTNVQRRI